MQALILLPEWQCGECTAALKLTRGCDTDATRPVVMDDEPQLRCPRRVLIDEPVWIGEIWWLYSKYVDGIFAEPGGLSDQPAKFIMAARILESAKASADGEKDKREKRVKALQSRINDVA